MLSSEAHRVKTREGMGQHWPETPSTCSCPGRNGAIVRKVGACTSIHLARTREQSWNPVGRSLSLSPAGSPAIRHSGRLFALWALSPVLVASLPRSQRALQPRFCRFPLQTIYSTSFSSRAGEGGGSGGYSLGPRGWSFCFAGHSHPISFAWRRDLCLLFSTFLPAISERLSGHWGSCGVGGA